MGLLRTAFYEAHVACGARLIDFGGWEMPVQYQGIIAEHQTVRKAAGLFDVSHMGEVMVRGAGSAAALNHMLCNDVRTIPVGNSQYTAILNPEGGIVDDVFVYRTGENEYLVCVNASNRAKDFNWLVANNPDPSVSIENVSDDWAQVAVQGPAAIAIVNGLCEMGAADLLAENMTRGGIAPGTFAGVTDCLIARTGYTGEDGFEIFIPVKEALPTWQRILDAGAAAGICPVGLGARDTLRLEVKNVLYGNDINDDTSPLEAGLRWITKLDKGEFIGRSALLAQKEAGLSRRLVALEIEGRIARPHAKILNAEGEIGEITSGSRSPSLGTNIALGYVSRGNGRPGTELIVDIRGRQAKATVVKGPFYQRK